MRQLLLVEWKKVKLPVLVMLVATTTASVILSSTVYRDYALEYDLEAWEVGMKFINFIFPLIATLPTAWLLYYERKNNFLPYIVPRVPMKKYLLSKWIVIVSSSGLTMFTVMFAGVITALYIKPDIIPILTYFDEAKGELVSIIESRHFLGGIFVHKPLLYGFLFSLWRGILAAIIATMAFVFGLYVENLFVIMTGPFIYTVLENFLFSVLNVPGIRLVTSFEPDSLSHVSMLEFFTGPLIAILFICFAIVYFNKVKKISIYRS